MNDLMDLKKASYTFRRYSSELLKSTYENADVNMKRFVKYIDDNSFISSYIHSIIDGIEYNFQDCFMNGQTGWTEIAIPEDENCHLKAMYDFMHYIVDEDKDVLGCAIRYRHSSNKFNDIIQGFLEKAFNPFIRNITDAILMEIMTLEEKDRAMPMMTQNIEKVEGNVFQQGTGTMNVSITASQDVQGIIDLINTLYPKLDEVEEVPQEVIDDAKDDLESIKEQLQAQVPKTNRIKKAITGIRNFMNDVSKKALVSVASNVVVQQMPILIERIEKYILSLK